MIIPELFKDKELACKCGCGLMPDKESVYKLYAMRLIFGKPMIITSGARCLVHNKAVGGAKDSTHLTGAFDIKVSPFDEYRLIQIAQFVGFTGIGIKDNKFIHVDDKREGAFIWTYGER